ncbi:VOC family protein [Psychroserpens sp. SPM9]|uniref:VOC family protein n=1 Tax=Psychroserpens sp. SPM9 TaxID=2975598 RepID=UPI0021A6CF07|nr:VOC family protein [Psychroserpens sp. SPM9]MDG5491301.1 glyoxalase [Psychroserpens sp. SPM9]
MKIKELALFTNQLDTAKKFYSKLLGVKIIEDKPDRFTLKIGWSKLTFLKSNEDYKYHYCFLIPSNKFIEALSFMEEKVDLIDIDKGRKTQRFETWNADSFYFYDGSGNVAEFIVRHDLKNQSSHSFSFEDVICVNEIGLPTSSIEDTNTILKKELNSDFWKGDTKHFGTNGTQEGLFLLPNYKTRTNWFPTELTITPSPFKAAIENNNSLYDFDFFNEDITVKKR